MKYAKLIVVFVVGWTTGMNYVPVECKTKEPEGIICAKQVPLRTEKTFKTKDSAEAFKEVMDAMKATGLTLSVTCRGEGLRGSDFSDEWAFEIIDAYVKNPKLKKHGIVTTERWHYDCG